MLNSFLKRTSVSQGAIDKMVEAVMPQDAFEKLGAEPSSEQLQAPLPSNKSAFELALQMLQEQR